MINTMLPTMQINVSNDATRFFILKSVEDYDAYLQRMRKYMGERFHHNLEDDSYMEGVLKSIIENGKKDFKDFLKRNKYKGSIKDVYFDEVLVHLRQIHQVMSYLILHV
ncbi:hypothetical protein ACLLS5_000562 [Salmonella enterica]|uniref:Uncharacterized protein n=8 Tax=Salmonella enterica TaxID=28901 RepID=A9MMG9_SALAR|nr:hypothetical protein [Salmonella enterica]ABX20838.1 hypothetical protein SARI_00925 [Salmonella enterica subsp. arizonae serovar 62:z4,z23:-]ASO63172.1 hypothetical protein LFZ50_21650 [Salmonella enterica subsp. arizonae serovar 53:-:- str. SA20100345]EAN8394030.1 hypothetical protein [Salmonella enterica subsp. arizonae serovar 13,23:gz51:-]EAT8891829.1 hypothetical protein [Salmonella enterica subsp. arizonae serovar 53:z4,z23,z32:-]EAT8922852.1 hypothetical protein [Salmonella enterica